MVAASCEVPVRSQSNYKSNLLVQVSIQAIQTFVSFLTFHVQSATQVLAEERVRHLTRLLAEPKYFGAHVTLMQPISGRDTSLSANTRNNEIVRDTTIINRKRERGALIR